MPAATPAFEQFRSDNTCRSIHRLDLYWRESQPRMWELTWFFEDIIRDHCRVVNWPHWIGSAGVEGEFESSLIKIVSGCQFLMPRERTAIHGSKKFDQIVVELLQSGSRLTEGGRLICSRLSRTTRIYPSSKQINSATYIWPSLSKGRQPRAVLLHTPSLTHHLACLYHKSPLWSLVPQPLPHIGSEYEGDSLN